MEMFWNDQIDNHHSNVDSLRLYTKMVQADHLISVTNTSSIMDKTVYYRVLI